MSIIIKEIDYQNVKDARILESALKNWFNNPKELNLTDSNMSYPFNFKKWVKLNYVDDDIKSIALLKENWIIGIGGLKFLSNNSRAHVIHIFIEPEHRGFGFKKRIIAHLEKLSIKKNCESLTLPAMSKDKNSIKLYKSMGFLEIKHRGRHIIFEKNF